MKLPPRSPWLAPPTARTIVPALSVLTALALLTSCGSCTRAPETRSPAAPETGPGRAAATPAEPGGRTAVAESSDESPSRPRADTRSAGAPGDGSPAVEAPKVDARDADPRRADSPVTDSSRREPARDEVLADLAPLEVPAAKRGRFAERVDYDGRELIRNGQGLCEWGFFGIDLYRAALYAERELASADDGLRADQVLVFHLEFSRSLTREQLGEAYTAATRVNAGAEFERHQPALDVLLDCLRDVKEGDRYTFVCDPARGLLIARDGDWVRRIEDAAFRQLFVRLYLGPDPPTEALRDGLLGAAAE